MKSYRFYVSAPSMVYGENLTRNVRRLSGLVDRVEIVVFHTPELHNIPSAHEVEALKGIRAETGVCYSVHLPSSLEIAARDNRERDRSVRLAVEILRFLAVLQPESVVMHIPVTRPTLTPEPGVYFRSDDSPAFSGWQNRAAESLGRIQRATGLGERLLVENINYSPALLEPFVDQGLCLLCLDIGHLMLGGECVGETLDRYLSAAPELHLHGVVGWREHLALDVIDRRRVESWVRRLLAADYRGAVNLEVFDPEDLDRSLRMLQAAAEGYRKKRIIT